ncbi:hypothetical protein [Aquimarina aquimarini]|uniref:hypothetical protein n=1 Tax=Aquimarina aquimarini TaxID=1191734 RepID=UPI000D5615B5|nr:hypothetical protein [Aquimarina aquimarini]
MKNHITVILLCFNFAYTFSQKEEKMNLNSNDAIYLLIDEKDELVLIEGKRELFLFVNKKGLNVKKKKDSIRQGLSPFYDTDKHGKVLVNDNPHLPWMHISMSNIGIIDSMKLIKHLVKSREESLAMHSNFSNKYAIKKQKNKNCYDVYSLYIYERIVNNTTNFNPNNCN